MRPTGSALFCLIRPAVSTASRRAQGHKWCRSVVAGMLWRRIAYRTRVAAFDPSFTLGPAPQKHSGGAGGIRTHEWRLCRPLLRLLHNANSRPEDAGNRRPADCAGSQGDDCTANLRSMSEITGDLSEARSGCGSAGSKTGPCMLCCLFFDQTPALHRSRVTRINKMLDSFGNLGFSSSQTCSCSQVIECATFNWVNQAGVIQW